MSTTSTDIDATLAAAAAVIRCLPVADVTAGEGAQGADAVAAAVPADAKAVTASIAGAASGQVIVVLSAALAEQVENGPVGPQDLVAALDPALTDATAALATSLGDIRYEAPQSLSAEIAIANAADYEDAVVVPFNSADGVVGALVVLTNSEATASADAASFENLSGTLAASAATRSVELLNDVEMGVTAELGRTRMTVRELLSMQPGSVVELDRAAGSPVDLLVNGTLVARGEVVVIDEEFGVRITEIIGYDNKKNG
jgi:flagellar motor switch protein FliN